MRNTDRDCFDKKLQVYKQKVESALVALVESKKNDQPARLYEAMSYSLLCGGKRLRPILCLATAESVGYTIDRVMPLAVALEMIHTASLIHDDLPCMDNDTLRRGKPTNHVVFGEALSLLAGTALIIWAFQHVREALSAQGIPDTKIVQALKILMDATGSTGIYGGQVLDTDPKSQNSADNFVYDIARAKTAILIQASVLSGAILSDISENSLQKLAEYGNHLGIAFQIVDDLLDVTGSSSELGKTPGKDADLQKRTFVTVFGAEKAKEDALAQSALAKQALYPIGFADSILYEIIEYLVERNR